MMPRKRRDSIMQPKTNVERRKRNIPAATDRRKHDATEKKAETVPILTDEASAFKLAMERYKRDNRRPFPTWSEVLEVLRSLGYRKVGEQTEAIPPGSEATEDTIATIDRRQRDVPVARERRQHDDAPPVPPKG
jgi:hypothetical protein